MGSFSSKKKMQNESPEKALFSKFTEEYKLHEREVNQLSLKG